MGEGAAHEAEGDQADQHRMVGLVAALTSPPIVMMLWARYQRITGNRCGDKLRASPKLLTPRTWVRFLLYMALSVFLFGLPVILAPATAHVGYTNDPAMMMWYMAWWPYAIRNGVNPFITHAVWPLSGYNLTWATSMPAVAIALAPIAFTLGVVSCLQPASFGCPSPSLHGRLICSAAA